MSKSLSPGLIIRKKYGTWRPDNWWKLPNLEAWEKEYFFYYDLNNAHAEDRQREFYKRTETIRKLFKDKGIDISIGGCGCCGSPSVVIKHGGETLVDEEDFNFSTMEDQT